MEPPSGTSKPPADPAEKEPAQPDSQPESEAVAFGHKGVSRIPPESSTQQTEDQKPLVQGARALHIRETSLAAQCLVLSQEEDETDSLVMFEEPKKDVQSQAASCAGIEQTSDHSDEDQLVVHK